jgi:uncharacterized protein YdeI (YjbR/CyaY-like superfamily)
VVVDESWAVERHGYERNVTSVDELPEKHFKTARAFETWLAKNHDKAPGVWLLLAKKSGGEKSVTCTEAVEVALCYGWIDGQGKAVDDKFSKQRFTPRTKRSVWSKINTERAERLVKEGRMQPAGQAEIDRAKADGRWAAASDSPSTMQVPDDFAAALKQNKRAAAAFETVSSANRYAFLWRIHNAKKPETRASRIENFVAMLERGETLH